MERDGALLRVRANERAWQEYVEGRDDWSFERVAVALDSAEDRIAVQAALPARIINSWTQPANLGISRHDFLGGPCLACLYLPSGERKSEDRLVAEALGLSGDADLVLVRRLLDTGEPVGCGLLNRLASNLRMPVEQLLDFEVQPLRHFYPRAVCGGAVLAMGGTLGAERLAEVPMAFQSALAGILLAAEVVLDATGLRALTGVGVPTRTEINLLRQLGRHPSSPERKHPSGRCLCEDEDYIQGFHAKYVTHRITGT
jgi:hypothetical protein